MRPLAPCEGSGLATGDTFQLKYNFQQVLLKELSKGLVLALVVCIIECARLLKNDRSSAFMTKVQRSSCLPRWLITALLTNGWICVTLKVYFSFLKFRLAAGQGRRLVMAEGALAFGRCYFFTS